MFSRNWIIQLIVGIVIAGVIIVGLVLASFVILPIIAVLIIALPLYFWLKNRGKREKKGTPGRRAETVKPSSYAVLDGEEKESH
jgi:Flp pilus assembly protein TadB